MMNRQRLVSCCQDLVTPVEDLSDYTHCMGVSISGGYPIAGWFIDVYFMENQSING